MPPTKRKPHTKKNPETSKKVKLSNDGAGSSAATELNDLLWKEIALPDGFQDAEGFFGLEEVDNVAVVKNAQGSVKYQLARSSGSFATNQSLPLESSPSTSEWEGFDDEVKLPTSLLKQEKALVKQETISKRETRSKQKKTKARSPKLESLAPGGSDAFKVLESISTEEVDVSAWSSLGLTASTLSSLASLGFRQPTPIQLSAIPEILAGHDVVGKAATGSGKTLAFAIPILEHYLLVHSDRPAKPKLDAQRSRDPLAMIVVPTRELAHQITAHLEALSSKAGDDGPRVATITGGLSVQKQRRVLAHSDVLVGTPGRLWEVIHDSPELLASLQKLKFLVLDEADRLLSDGHYQEVKDILSSLDREDQDASGPINRHASTPSASNATASGSSAGALKRNHAKSSNPKDRNPAASHSGAQRQTLVFSATFQRDLQQKLAGKRRASHQGDQDPMQYLLEKLKFQSPRPRFIDANPMTQMATTLREGLVECAGMEKDLYLYAVLLHHQKARVLIFANSIASVQRLAPLLQNLGVEAHALHSQMSQKARLRAVERFAASSKPNSILVATDVAARGLDIPSVQLVVHYHLPRTADMYVHRSGRTARRSQAGSSILLCAPEEAQGVRRLIAKVHASHHQDHETGFFLRTLDLDRQMVSQLKNRVALAKRIADAAMAKEKGSSEDAWLRAAAMELGADVDESMWRARGTGRGRGRMAAQKEARSLSKHDLTSMRQQLAGLLGQKVNVGVSAKYLSAGGIDVDALLQNTGNADLLGHVESLGL